MKKTNCAKRSRNEWYEIYDELCSNVDVALTFPPDSYFMIFKETGYEKFR